MKILAETILVSFVFLLFSTGLLADNSIPLTAEAKAPFPSHMLRPGFNYADPETDFELAFAKAHSETSGMFGLVKPYCFLGSIKKFAESFDKAFDSRSLKHATCLIDHHREKILQPQTQHFELLWKKYHKLSVDKTSIALIAENRFTDAVKSSKLFSRYDCTKYSTYRVPMIQPNGVTPGELIVTCRKLFETKINACNQDTFDDSDSEYKDILNCKIGAIKEYKNTADSIKTKGIR